ncbi:Ger(x)C family spore germination protein [Paenibacillus kobensis]|uniref:Ger(x)C family spore germination protein n=1 Tax=Paenibacillus kobensis TaxID=59841 RepID=UPI000FDA6DA6|nr:Ger(x)C family spore germination protein [Paenibacillus kobensis]
MIARLMRLSLLLPLFALLSGCWDRIELNDLLLVTALAFDQEKGQVVTTVQFLLPRSQTAVGGTGGGSPAAKQTSVRAGKGYNVADALSKLQRKLPRKLFWGQCKVFIFGEELAKSGIRDELDFLIRHPQPRERSYMFVSRGKAADMLEVYPPLERSSAEVLRELSDMRIGYKVTLQELNMKLKGESRAVALPLVSILQPNKTADPFQTISYIHGTAIFHKDRKVGDLSEKVSQGLLWLLNEVNEFTVTFPIGDSNRLVSISPIKAKVKLIPYIKGDQWTMTVRVEAQGDMVENDSNWNPTSEKLLDQMDRAFEKEVKRYIDLAANDIQHRLKTDVIGFGTAYHRKYPKHWKQVEDRWDEQFQQIKVVTKVHARILRTGNVSNPGGLPEEEIKQK